MASLFLWRVADRSATIAAHQSDGNRTTLQSATGSDAGNSCMDAAGSLLASEHAEK